LKKGTRVKKRPSGKGKRQFVESSTREGAAEKGIFTGQAIDGKRDAGKKEPRKGDRL